jgi:hypothetical protein
MLTNLERYQNDVDSLITKGQKLQNAIQAESRPDEFKRVLKEELKRGGEKGLNAAKLESVAQEFIRDLPSFKRTYQEWYSEARALIRQVLPDRLADFIRHYEKPKARKNITFENYTIEDHLQGMTIRRGVFDDTKIVGPEAAIPQFQQQLAILESARVRFQSSLFDIRQLVQADIFDSELDAAEELAKNKFTRAAGAMAGVVLERHLAQVCENHAIKVAKKSPGISDLNNVLKDASVIDVPQWRFIQHLADIRNLCDHNKKTDPTVGQVDDLVAGVRKITKTLFWPDPTALSSPNGPDSGV